MLTERTSGDGSPLFVFAGGGTGGHLYPALAVSTVLRERFGDARIVFFGTERPIDGRILDGTDCELVKQGLPRLSAAPWRWPAIVAGYRKSTARCKARFEHDRPAVVVGTGGLGSVPAVCEAARQGIPTALLNPDAVPGRANRYVAPRVDMVFAQWGEALGHFPPAVDVRVLGCPVRRAFNRASRQAGVERFGLDPDLKTLLVTGASQGARTVNEAIAANMDFLTDQEDWQILHLTGEGDFERFEGLYRERSLRATVLSFTDYMFDALAAADLVVSRAGASTLAEITALGKPSVLMPYPFHKDMHQLANARCLVSAPTGAAARIVHDAVDASVNGPALREAIEPLMTDARKRGIMSEAAERLGRGNAAQRVADDLAILAGVTATEAAPAPCEILEGSC